MKSSTEVGRPQPSTAVDDWPLRYEQLIQILEATSDGVWVCDTEPKLLWINETCEKLNDIRRKDVVGRSVKQLLGYGNFDTDVTHRVLQSRKTVAIIQKVKSGRTLLVNGAPVFDDQGAIQFVVGTERDLTELNMVREELESTRQLQQKIQSELTTLNLQRLGVNEVVAQSEIMTQVLETCMRVATFDSTVLLTGQSGTGKSLIAGLIHKASPRTNNSFLSLNCGAIPASLVEAELFGYVEGAFSGAQKGGKPGLIEAADGGTLFLDEIDSFTLELQVKLLTFLDTQRFIRVGDNTVKQVDVRLIVATNQNLSEKVNDGLFREDLLYRLSVLPIELPPLSERIEDIPLLIHHCLAKLSKRYNQSRTINSQAIELLCRYPFPGNVRELENVLERAFVLSQHEDIGVQDLPDKFRESLQLTKSKATGQNYQQAIMALEREYLLSALEKSERQQDIAKELGVSQPTVARLLKKHNLSTK
jgi:PAS domain S-box-containing protein